MELKSVLLKVIVKIRKIILIALTQCCIDVLSFNRKLERLYLSIYCCFLIIIDSFLFNIL